MSTQTNEKYEYIVRRRNFHREDFEIEGRLYLPVSGKGPYPAVLIGHGFGASMLAVANYAQNLAEHGIAACIIDFCGGGAFCESDGSPYDMSALTEAEDMKAVAEELRLDSHIDRNSFFLMGQSMGGLAAALAAADIPDMIRGLILLYPAFVIPDDMKRLKKRLGSTPEKTSIMGVPVGKKFIDDAVKLKVFDKISAYTGPVLIFHGTKDSLVPLSYSKQADEVFKSSQLVVIEGADHGFSERQNFPVYDEIVRFIRKNETKSS